MPTKKLSFDQLDLDVSVDAWIFHLGFLVGRQSICRQARYPKHAFISLTALV